MDHFSGRDKQEDAAPCSHGLSVRSVIAKSYILFMPIIAVVLAIFYWQIRTSYSRVRTTEIQLTQLANLEGAAAQHDEMRAMSATMAAATRDVEQVNQHEELGPRVGATIEGLSHIFKEDTADALNVNTILRGLVDDTLDSMECEAISLTRRGEHDNAIALLQSAEYQEQRRAYNEGMRTFAEDLRNVLENRLDRGWERVRIVCTALGIVLPVILLAWLLVSMVQTHRRQSATTEQHLHTFRKEWQKTFNAISDGICIVERNKGTILQCNIAMTRFLKQPYKQIVGRTCCELIHGAPEPAKRCPLQRMCKTGRSETTDFRIGEKWLRIRVDPLKDSDGEIAGAVHITSDITEQRKANRALRESENKFRLAFENAQDAILWVDLGCGVLTKCNKATEDLFGRRRRDIVGRHHTMLSPVGKAVDFHGLLSGSAGNLGSNVETEILTKEGQTKTVTVSLSAMTVDGKDILQAIVRDITESKRANEEIKNLAKFPGENPHPVLRMTKDGKILYANDASSSLLNTWKVQEGETLPEPWDKRIQETARVSRSETYELECADGRTFILTLQPISGSGYVNIYGHDITKRKKAENEKTELELQLSQQQKMEAIGTLAGGIAHDFNNILAAMQGYLELSLDDLANEAAVRSHLEKVVTCVTRATKLVRQILTFSRKNEQEQEKEPLQVSSIVREVHGMLRSSLPATMKFNRKIMVETSVVIANATQLHQVLVNLCTNASRAMQSTGGLLEVTLDDVDLKSETKVGDELLRPGCYVKIAVTDTGCGMEKEVLDRIFEPFFTTRKAGEGTGLGLSVVHGIIKSHNGAISASSTPGKGSTFEIFLPKLGSVEIQEGESSGQCTKDKETILLVDDEEIMVDVTKQILGRLGYEVIAKTNSVDALETFQAEPGRFDLVLTDQVMPNMTGTELAEELISIRPDISIILCSGFPENVDPQQLDNIGIKEFILKPITRQEIANVIRKVLNNSPVTT